MDPLSLTTWQLLVASYLTGIAVTASLTFFFSRDPSLGIRLLCAALIGLTWPLSFPLVLIFILL
ncbi:GhoT/OrtT family toxin [Candidatus Sodalis endolongispinus]|uniref:GhoT/OrtT family toxin n=1 Tax=Candidatus Sodalis endolongispinus TaxID=2812662 RepID=A0ABS5Y974_9GAMM|nr:GhoT/OrtT family toxin [Candidatus Sodalis endolongispinus]MBT9431085.1 GhoT/OrtT family toxin [Candidatus Sodalis endolongispinus]